MILGHGGVGVHDLGLHRLEGLFEDVRGGGGVLADDYLVLEVLRPLAADQRVLQVRRGEQIVVRARGDGEENCNLYCE